MEYIESRTLLRVSGEHLSVCRTDEKVGRRQELSIGPRPASDPGFPTQTPTTSDSLNSLRL
jgi:hypothetical protein